MDKCRVLNEIDIDLIPNFTKILHSRLEDIKEFYPKEEVLKTIERYDSSNIIQELVDPKDRTYVGHFNGKNLDGILIEGSEILTFDNFQVKKGVIYWVMAQESKKGIGSGLILNSIERAKTRGEDVLCLGVSANNVGAVRAYQQLGFELNQEYGNNMLMLCYYINPEVKPR